MNGSQVNQAHELFIILITLLGRHGTIEGDIGFTLGVCQGGYTPREGDTVTVDCVECKHHNMGWRALKVLPSNLQIPQTQRYIL